MKKTFEQYSRKQKRGQTILWGKEKITVKEYLIRMARRIPAIVIEGKPVDHHAYIKKEFMLKGVAGVDAYVDGVAAVIKAKASQTEELIKINEELIKKEQAGNGTNPTTADEPPIS